MTLNDAAALNYMSVDRVLCFLSPPSFSTPSHIRYHPTHPLPNRDIVLVHILYGAIITWSHEGKNKEHTSEILYRWSVVFVFHLILYLLFLSMTFHRNVWKQTRYKWIHKRSFMTYVKTIKQHPYVRHLIHRTVCPLSIPFSSARPSVRPSILQPSFRGSHNLHWMECERTLFMELKGFRLEISMISFVDGKPRKNVCRNQAIELAVLWNMVKESQAAYEASRQCMNQVIQKIRETIWGCVLAKWRRKLPIIGKYFVEIRSGDR